MARLRADNRKRERTAFQMWVHIQLCKHNETQSCLAAVMGISQQAVSAKLNGKSEITLDDIYEKGLARPYMLVKVLGDGEVKGAISVEAHRFSRSAAEKIRAAGGTVNELCADVLCEVEVESETAEVKE